jgi:hypothetical protein
VHEARRHARARPGRRRDHRLVGQLMTMSKVQKLLAGPLATEIRDRVPLAGFAAALDAYQRTMSGGKILFTTNA